MSNRTGTALLTAALMIATTGGVWAQPAGHYDEGGIRAALLTNRSVQLALKLDAGQSEQVTKLAKDVAAKGRAAAREFGTLTEAERREKMHGMMTATCKEAMGALCGISRPHSTGATTRSSCSKAGSWRSPIPKSRGSSSCTREQKGRIHDLAKELHGQMVELAHKASPGKMEDLHDQGLVLHWKAIDQATALLNADQRATWKSLIGDRFDIKVEDRQASDAR